MSIVILWQRCVADRFPRFDGALGDEHICLDERDVNRSDFPNDTQFIFFVSLQMRYKLENKGIHPYYCDDDYVFEVGFPLVHFRNLMLNQSVIFLPLGCVKDWMIDNNKETVFIRPNSGNKIFPGQTVNVADFEIFRNTYKSDPMTMCAVSEPKSIKDETRIFVCKDEFVCAPYSHWDGGPLNEVIDVDICGGLYDKLSSCFYLPDAYVFDVCMHNGEAKIIELNSISTSGTYNKSQNIAHLLVRNITDL